jgi:hypothetical protein
MDGADGYGGEGYGGGEFGDLVIGYWVIGYWVMKLFEVQDIKVPELMPDLEAVAVREVCNEGLTKTIGMVMPGEACTYWSNGDWSLWELVDYLLEQTGPGTDIYLATWSISELSARKLVQWMENGRIGKMVGVVDVRSKNRHPAAFHLSKNIFSEIRVAYCHAKVTVLVGNGQFISINGSANWTENPRLESGVIINSLKTAMGNINLIEEVVRKGEFELE